MGAIWIDRLMKEWWMENECDWMYWVIESWMKLNITITFTTTLKFTLINENCWVMKNRERTECWNEKEINEKSLIKTTSL